MVPRVHDALTEGGYGTLEEVTARNTYMLGVRGSPTRISVYAQVAACIYAENPRETTKGIAQCKRATDISMMIRGFNEYVLKAHAN
jgi:hypothetical protein